MPAKRRFRFLSPPLHAGHRAVLLAVATVIALGAGTSASLASTGSVYFDGNFNVGAGHDFFGGTAPPNGSNVGVGYSVMPNLTIGTENTAIGRASLRGDTSGRDNTATGYLALADNTLGAFNTATGSNALARNTQGQFDTASGFAALRDNTIGVADTATGDHALFSNKTGEANTAMGESALTSNKSGSDNTATGTTALASNTTGQNNVASGVDALTDNTTGSSNVALGFGAGQNLTTGSNNIDIGNRGHAAESGTIRIGTEANQQAAFLAGVFGRTASGATKAVVINKNGQLGTAPAPAAPRRSHSQTLSRLRERVGQLATEVQRLREQVGSRR